MTEATVLTPPGSTARWVAPALAVATGLAAVSGICGILARLPQTQTLPLLTDQPDVDAVLSRSAVVGVGMLAAFGVFALLVMRRGGGEQDTAQRRAALLRHLAPAMATLAAAGLWWRTQEATRELFEDAHEQQAALRGSDVAGLASIAWLCACLAVLVLAAVAGVGGPRRPDGSDDRHRRVLVPAIAAFTALAVGGVSVLALDWPTVHQLAAAPAEPAEVNIAGPVAYEIPIDTDADAFLVAGGPGLLRSIGKSSTPDGVEALSGATGEQVWSFSYPDLWVHGIAVSAANPETGGVAVLQASYRSHLVLIGLDAATGTPLWTRPDTGALTADRFGRPQVSSQRFLSVRSVRPSPTSSRRQREWTVRELRTGNPLWSFTAGSDCDFAPTLTETFVLTPRCGDAEGIDVLDGQSGARHDSLTAEDLGAGVSATDRLRASPLPGTDLVALSSPVFPVTQVRPAALIDIATGTIVRQLPANNGVAVLDARTLILTDAQHQQVILNLDTDAAIETGLSTETLKYNTGFGSVWARVGDRWVTLTPLPGQMPALHVFSHEEPMETYPSPCSSENVPNVKAIAGALLVNCADRIVAVR